MELIMGKTRLAIEPEVWQSGPMVMLTLARETESTVTADEHGIYLTPEQARELGFYTLGASGLVRPEVLRFARLMEEKLAKHDGDKAGWKDVDPIALCYHCYNHLVKLIDRLKNSAQPDIIARDIADCLNYLMMIADVCGLLPTGEEGTAT